MPRVDDRDQLPACSAEGDDDRIKVSEGGDVVAELLGPTGGDLNDVGHEEAAHVEVMDRHVAADSARVPEVRRGRRLGSRLVIVRCSAGRCRPARPGGGVGRSADQPTVEAEDNGNRRGAGLLAQRVDPDDVEVDGLFA